MSRIANEVLMLLAKIKTLEEHAVIANKSVLEAEKVRDKLHKELRSCYINIPQQVYYLGDILSRNDI